MTTTLDSVAPATVLRGRLAPETALAYLTAGNATLTCQNDETGNRFTYRVRASEPRPGQAPVHFVKVLTHPDNETGYVFLGTIFEGGRYAHGRRSPLAPGTPAERVFTWVLTQLQAKTLPPTVSLWHEGRCGRCGRKLTVPESVATGYGPECAGLLGIARVQTTLDTGEPEHAHS